MTDRDQWDGGQGVNRLPEEELERVPRCRIPQEELTDAFAIAEKYDFNTVQDAFLFKDLALRGALELKHLEYADAITKQMSVLVDAQNLIARKD